MQEKPEILIHDGKLDFKALGKLNITNDELKEAISASILTKKTFALHTTKG